MNNADAKVKVVEQQRMTTVEVSCRDGQQAGMPTGFVTCPTRRVVKETNGRDMKVKSMKLIKKKKKREETGKESKDWTSAVLKSHGQVRVSRDSRADGSFPFAWHTTLVARAATTGVTSKDPVERKEAPSTALAIFKCHQARARAHARTRKEGVGVASTQYTYKEGTHGDSSQDSACSGPY